MFSATYSPEDNKLRLSASSRLSAEDYAKVKAAGFRWAPKQEIFVAPSWSPQREDLLLEFVDEIDDEDYSPEERAADRAERFSDYRDKRRAEAGDLADTFEAGPSAFGHQNRARAERLANRHDRFRTRSVSQWSKAEYWQQRTEAVISHALHRSSPEVRRGRILRLEAEQRKHQAGMAEAQKRYDRWAQVASMDGAESLLPLNENGYADPSAMNPAQALAYLAANDGHCWIKFDHPTCEEANAECERIHRERGFSPHDLLTRSDFIGKPFDRLTPKQVAELYVARIKNPSEQGGWLRWSAHYEMRLTYERAMLAAEGGSAAEVAIEPGGWFGKFQVQKVNKSNTTGRVVSVLVYGPPQWGEKTNPDGSPKIVLRKINIERLGEDAYRAPTDEERAAFKVETAERKAERKATTPKAPPLVNPTEADAERLQALWNARALECHAEAVRKFRTYGDYTPTEVVRMTQADYSERSKGTYTRFETVNVCADGHRPPRQYGSDRPEASNPVTFKIRKRCGGGGHFYQADCVVVITDKPQKPLPLDWDNLSALPAEVAAAV